MNISNNDYYWVIAVDLNGSDGKPNRTTTSNTDSLPPDIVMFAVLKTGEVLPVGVAADTITIGDKRYRYLNTALRAQRIDGEGSTQEQRGNVYFSDNKYNNTRPVTMNFRNAYCSTADSPSSILTAYCNGLTRNNNSDYVLTVETIKPVFRYGF